ncbi:MAG: hypothetical protein ACK4V7_07960 [Chitinophagaceae bacterium]
MSKATAKKDVAKQPSMALSKATAKKDVAKQPSMALSKATANRMRPKGAILFG